MLGSFHIVKVRETSLEMVKTTKPSQHLSLYLYIFLSVTANAHLYLDLPI